MLRRVELEKRSLADYGDLIPDALAREIQMLGAKLAGRRLLFINATAKGGGVVEILKAELPLLTDLGLQVDWQVIEASADFFEITKQLHNSLQGDAHDLIAEKWRIYEDYNRELAKQINPSDWDFILVQDPQPAPLAGLVKARQPAKTKWIWRCHIDTSSPDPEMRQHFLTYLDAYDGFIFTLQEFVMAGLPSRPVEISAPAIDPLSSKNQLLKPAQAVKLVEQFGIDTAKPLVVQVSRLDPWKDLLGTIEAYGLAKAKVPDLQLAIIGNTPVDDPEGERVLKQLEKAVAGQSGAYLIANQADDQAVRAFQQTAMVVVQKSLKEGFGLTVTEALWAGTPVIGSPVGGIPLQVKDGENGFLVKSVKEVADRIVELVTEPDKAKNMGERSHQTVRRQFLIPRLVRDDLRFLANLSKGRSWFDRLKNLRPNRF